MKKQLLGMWICLCMALLLLPAVTLSASAADGYDGGEGTDASPYIIRTAGQLRHLAGTPDDWDKHFQLGGDIDLSAVCGADVEGGVSWTPIGSEAKRFTGVLDGAKDGGGSYKITRLYINAPGEGNQGLFGCVGKDGAVKNLSVEDGMVTGGRENVGGMVGVNYGTVESCRFDGTVTGEKSVGGVVGDNFGTVESCRFNGTVTGESRVGGVAGYNSDISIQGEWTYRSVMKDCYNAGSVTGGDYVGGVVGRNIHRVESCYNTGPVTGREEVGGVVGHSRDMVKDCCNTGPVTGGSSVGGVVGSNCAATVTVASLELIYIGTVESCYNTGLVSGGSSVGGVLGSFRREDSAAGTVKNCYNIGFVTGDDSVGGVVGYSFNTYSDSAVPSIIENCYNIGAVTGDGSVGGVLGWNNAGAVRNCFFFQSGCVNWGLRGVGRGEEAGVANVTAKGVVEFAAADTPEGNFDGWDFGAVWGMGGLNSKNVRPVLRDNREEINEALGYCDHDSEDECGGDGDCGCVRDCLCKHRHAWSGDWEGSATHHWHECTAGCYVTENSDKDGYAAHTSGDWIVDQAATVDAVGSRHKQCTVCGRVTETGSIPKLEQEPAAPPPPAAGGGTSGGGWSWSPLYTVTVAETDHGEVRSNRVRAEAGGGVTLNAAPDGGYELVSLRAADRSGREVALKDKGDGTYTFNMPGSDVTVTAIFAARAAVPSGGEKEEKKACPRDNTCPLARFVDMDASLWYHDGTHYCIENGLMGGVSRLYFAPNIATNRAMFAAILYRLGGSPAAGSGGFTDVPAGKWYAAPIAWAAANGVMEGCGNGKFKPEAPITREQMAAALYRYARYKGYDVSARGNLTDYTDGHAVSGWAADALSWAVGEGLVTGISSRILFLDPAGNATRAQAATILMRFCTDVMK